MNRDLPSGLSVGSARLWGLEAGFALPDCSDGQPMAWYTEHTARAGRRRRFKRTHIRLRFANRDLPRRNTGEPHGARTLSP